MEQLQKRNPWWWIPTLYIGEGLPNVVVMTVAVGTGLLVLEINVKAVGAFHHLACYFNPTVGAGGQGRDLSDVMSPSLVPSRFGDLVFRMCHN